MNVDGSFVGIIDIYDKNDQIDLTEAWRLGVRAIFHETGMGLFKRDRAYVARKAAALQKGLSLGCISPAEFRACRRSTRPVFGY